MTHEFHLRITVKNEMNEVYSYVPEGGHYLDRQKAIEAGSFSFGTTPKVIMVEVFQSGVAAPIALYQ